MPTILFEGPIPVFSFCLWIVENHRNIHIRRDNCVAKFWLDPISLQQTGGFNRAELNRIAKLVETHRELFLERWA